LSIPRLLDGNTDKFRRDKGLREDLYDHQELILDALEQAQLILAEYIEPGAARRPDVTIEQLLLVLDRQDLAAAQAHVKAGYSLRPVQ
jgi:hypothetical protein